MDAAHQAVLQLVQDRIATLYFGSTDAASINPAIIALIEQVVQQILAGCTPPAAAQETGTKHPMLVRAYVKNVLRFNAVKVGLLTTVDLNKATDTVLGLASQSTPDEATSYLAASLL